MCTKVRWQTFGAAGHRGQGGLSLQGKGKLGHMCGTQRSRLTFEKSVEPEGTCMKSQFSETALGEGESVLP